MAEPVPDVSGVDIALRDLSRIFCHISKKDTIIIPKHESSSVTELTCCRMEEPAVDDTESALIQ